MACRNNQPMYFFKPLKGSVEHEAVEYCDGHSWCIPDVTIAHDVLRCRKGREVYSLLKSETLSPPDTLAVVKAMFKVMQKVHASGCLHLDFHPKNVILCEERTSNCTVVECNKKKYGCYVIDFETMWYPGQSADKFDAVSRHWNALTRNGLGRLMYDEYSIQTDARYDVYTLSVYLLKYLEAAIIKVDGLKETLYRIAGLPTTRPIVGIQTIDGHGNEETYYVYLTDSAGAKPVSVATALELLDSLFG